MPVAAPINDKEIAILGGKYSGTDCSNDIFIFNIKTAKLKQVVNKNPIKFSSVINNAACYTPNSLVALPTDQQGVPIAIEFTKGLTALKVISNL